MIDRFDYPTMCNVNQVLTQILKYCNTFMSLEHLSSNTDDWYMPCFRESNGSMTEIPEASVAEPVKSLATAKPLHEPV